MMALMGKMFWGPMASWHLEPREKQGVIFIAMALELMENSWQQSCVPVTKEQ